jgi:primosomal replication protein N
LSGGAQDNHVRLLASLIGREELRYTPAGVPVLNLRLAHRSRQMEAKHPREVELEMQAVAIGAVAQRLAALPDGQALALTGFLANRSRRSIQVVLHVNEFEIEEG